MNLYTIRLTASSPFSKLLSTHGFKLIQTIPKTKDTNAPVAWILVKHARDLDLVANLRKKLPQTWIVLVVPPTWLTNEKLVSALVECHDKNDIATTQDWFKRFWFVLQAGLSHQTQCREVLRLKKEGNILSRQINDMSERATLLISQLEKNLELAEGIQRSLLPKFTPDIPGVNLCVKYLPASGVGGDYYDIFEFGDKRRFGFLLADSQNHGIAALLLSILLKVRLEEMKERFSESRSFVDFLSRELLTHRKDMATLNLLYGILDRHSLSFEFTVAGNLCPFLVRHGKVETLVSHINPPLGSVDHSVYRENRLTLKPGDLMILHTDGLEQPLSERDGIHRLIESVFKEQESPDSLFVQNEILARIRAYSHSRALTDDITLMQIHVLEKALYLASHSK